MTRSFAVAGFALALTLAAASAAEAQPRLLVGGGFSAPNGSIADVADPGYHAQLGLQIRLPSLPLSLRGDGGIHRLGAANASLSRTQVIGGAASVIFHLPGVGLQPYVLGGVGSYRTKSGPAGAPSTVTDTGYHGGFGLVLGGTGLGGFAELRYVRISDPGSTTLIPLTLGLRF